MPQFGDPVFLDTLPNSEPQQRSNDKLNFNTFLTSQPSYLLTSCLHPLHLSPSFLLQTTSS